MINETNPTLADMITILEGELTLVADGPWEAYAEYDVGMPVTLMQLLPTGRKTVPYHRQTLEPLSPNEIQFVADARNFLPVILAELRKYMSKDKDHDKGKQSARTGSSDWEYLPEGMY